MVITRETIEDVKRLKEEMLKAKEDGEGKCEDGKNCQKVIVEAELETWLAKGWEAKIVLPSGKNRDRKNLILLFNLIEHYS